MSVFKRLLILVLAVVAVLIAGAIFLVATFDPNEHKQEIVSAVKQHTGRELTLEGDIALSLFPWLGVALGPTQLSNAAGFGNQPFASIQAAEIKVGLLSLLKGELLVDTLSLKSLVLDLQMNKQGRTNWDDLLESTAGAETPETEETQTPSELAVTLGGIDIEDARVRWLDQRDGTQVDLGPINLHTGEISPGQPIDMVLDLQMKSTQPPMETKFSSKGIAVLDPEQQRYQLKDMKMTIDAKGAELPKGRLVADIGGDVLLDLVAENISFGWIQIAFDDSTLEGNISVHSFSQPAIKFDLKMDGINLDHYMPASEEPSEHAESSDDRIALPIDTLRTLNIDGQLAVQQMVLSNLQLKDVQVGIDAHQGLVNLTPLKVSLYEGKIKGNGSVDVRSNQPRYAFKSDINHIEMGQFMADLQGDAFLNGHADLGFKLATSGDQVSTVKRNLNGSLSLAMNKGTIRDEELARTVEKVVAFFEKRDKATSGTEILFDSLTATGKITNGVLHNKDLRLVTSLLLGKGVGSASLVQEHVDYELGIARNKGNKPDSERTWLPIVIKGSFDKLNYDVQFGKAIEQKQKKKIEKKKQEAKEKVDKKLEEKKDKLKERLREKLKL